MKNEYIQVRVTEDDKRALAELAERLDVPASQIVRESVREKIAALVASAEETKELAVQE
jgi:predicted transcriptional regulator